MSRKTYSGLIFVSSRGVGAWRCGTLLVLRISIQLFLGLLLSGAAVAQQNSASQDALITKLVADLSQRRADAEQALIAIREKQKKLGEKSSVLQKALEEKAANLGILKDLRITSIDTQIDAAVELIKTLSAEIQAPPTASFKNLEEMLAYDRAEDLKKRNQRKIKAINRQIEVLGKTRIKQVSALLRAERSGSPLSETWDQVQAEMALTQDEFTRAQAKKTKALRDEERYLQEWRASQREVVIDEKERVIPSPVDAEDRMRRFEKRSTPEAVRELGEEFFAQMRLTGPGLEKVRHLVEAKDYGAALDAYKSYFFLHLNAGAPFGGEDVSEASTEEDQKIDAEFDSVSSIPVPVNSRILEKALQGRFVYTLTMGKGIRKTMEIRLGVPGAINWCFAGMNQDWQLDLCQQLGNPLELGVPFWKSYLFGGPKEHLLRWSEMIDDWAMNWQRDVENSPLPIRNYSLLIVCRVDAIRSMLVGCAKLRPSFVKDVPATTLARLLMVTNQEYVSSSIRLGRAGLYNLRIIALNSMIPNAIKLQEFHVWEWALREGWRQTDNNFIFKTRRDGANFEFSNDGHEDTDQSMMATAEAVRAWQKLPDWLEPFWWEEFNEKFLSNTRYWIHNLKQDGFSYRLNARSQASRYSGKDPLYKVNRLWDEPEVRRRMWNIFELGQPESPPQINSESMAFQGYYYLRGGWNPDDYFFYFQTIGQPILSGREDNTGFMFYQYGLPMLLAPATTVDGKVQNIHYGSNTKSGGKSYYANYGLPDSVKLYRFLGGKKFDFCEGSFEGVYQYARPNEFFYPFGVYDWIGKRDSALDDPIKDVIQRRQILTIKGRNIYLFTDIVDSDLQHSFSQYYTVYTPVRNDNLKERVSVLQNAGGNSLEIDEKNRRLKTKNRGLPNTEIAQFSSFPVRYDVCAKADLSVFENGSGKAQKKSFTKRENQAGDAGHVKLLNQKVAARWEGKGRQLLVTVMATTPSFYGSEAPELVADIKPIPLAGAAAGFSGKFTDGTPISYVAYSTPNEIRLGSLVATASALLLSGENGIALDCEKIAGISPGVPDFTFHIDKGAVVLDEPIYRPIQPVIIEPKVNVFIDTTRVTLRCATPGVEIRYTLDNSKPVPQSPLYKGPFEVSKTCRLKARAFRVGISEDVWQEDGTLATVVYSTVLRKESPLPALSPVKTSPGISYEYFEGPWTTLMARSLDMPAKKEGVLPRILDVSPRETAGAFGIRYTGFIELPVTGVYTFYAPREYTFPDVDCGYDLRVFVDGKEWGPAVRWQGQGTWSVALQKGKHEIRVAYVDARLNPRKIEFVWGFPDPSFTWDGKAPSLCISGPELTKQEIPASILSHR